MKKEEEAILISAEYPESVEVLAEELFEAVLSGTDIVKWENIPEEAREYRREQARALLDNFIIAIKKDYAIEKYHFGRGADM